MSYHSTLPAVTGRRAKSSPPAHWYLLHGVALGTSGTPACLPSQSRRLPRVNMHGCHGYISPGYVAAVRELQGTWHNRTAWLVRGTSRPMNMTILDPWVIPDTAHLQHSCTPLPSISTLSKRRHTANTLNHFLKAAGRGWRRFHLRQCVRGRVPRVTEKAPPIGPAPRLLQGEQDRINNSAKSTAKPRVQT